MEQGEAQGECVDTDETDDEEALGVEAVGQVAGRDLHQGVDEGRYRGQSACLRKREIEIISDQREEQRDSPEGESCMLWLRMMRVELTTGH